MALVRMAFLFPALIASLLAAQVTNKPILKIEAQDLTGASVQDSVIQVHSDSGFDREIRTDGRGEAALRLDPGRYLITLNATGFKVWKSSIEMNLDANPVIRAKLEIGNTCSPCVTIDEPTLIAFEHPILNVEISVLALETLSLPAHRLRLMHLHRAA